ncbi:MAG: AAA family ATPase, partial [Candidatus Methylomirabilia bacterium]
ELDQLRKALERVAQGHGQVVGVVGEPGVGKSRLFYEFMHSHRAHGWLVLESGSVSYGKATPYRPVIDLLKGYFKIQDRDDQREIRDKVIGRLFGLDRALEPTLLAFLALLDVPVEDPQWHALNPPQRRQRTLDGIKRLLLRESQVQPLLVVVEDLHWIDSETQALLDGLIEGLPTARLLLLVNYRPEYEHHWGRKTYYTQLRLDPLPPESADELLQALLGTDDSVQPLKPVLIERIEGNPFFLEESVRTLVETQVLVGERGAYRLAKPVQTIQVPATVQAVLAARIDRLPPEEKRLLQAASAIGKDVPFPLLQAITELPEQGLRQSLTHLQAAEFLYETSLFPELEYTFKHALTHEVAYGSLLQERRRALHARIVEAIERLYSDRLAENVERLAHHALRGEVRDKALTYCWQAGSKSFARAAPREAAACLEQALVALGHLPESPKMTEQAIDLRLELRNALFAFGDLGRIHKHLREAEILAQSLDDRPRLGRVAVNMLHHFWELGDYDRALESGQRALGIAADLGDFALEVATNLRLGYVYHAMGQYPQALEVTRWNVQSLSGELIHDRLNLPFLPSVWSRTWLAWCLAERGDFAEGIAHTEEGVRIAEAADEWWSRIVAYYGVGVLRLHKGELAKAIPQLERGLELSRMWKMPVWLAWTAGSLGYAYALSGRVTEALPLLEQAVEQTASMGMMTSHSLWIVYLGEAHLLGERRDHATQLALRARDLSRELEERGHQARALRLLGEIALYLAPANIEKVEKVQDHYREAMALAEELGMCPLLAHCHLGLGKLYRRTGNRPKAQGDFTSAAALFREMDMRFWLEQAEAELKALG